ncbi:MAG: hypothetical protein ACYC0J_09455 [Gammaproteobacteria bacterium]
MYPFSMTRFAAEDFKTQLIVALNQYISGFSTYLKHGLTAEEVHFSEEEKSKGIELAIDYIQFINQYPASEVAAPLWERIQRERVKNPIVDSLHASLDLVFAKHLKLYDAAEFQKQVLEIYHQRYAQAADPCQWNVYREMWHSNRQVQQEWIDAAMISIRPITILRAKL